ARWGPSGKAAAGGGGVRLAGANPTGGTRGRGRGHRVRPKYTGPGAPWSRAAPSPSGARAGEPPPLPSWAPQPSRPRPSPPAPPSRGSAVTVAGRRAPPPSPSASCPHAPPVFPPSRLVTAGWLGEEGRWPQRSLGGRLPLSREPPWEQEDGGDSGGRPGGGGAEAPGAERGGSRERQRLVSAPQNRNQLQPRSHLSRRSRQQLGSGARGSRDLLHLRLFSSPAPPVKQPVLLAAPEESAPGATAPRGAGRRPWTCGLLSAPAPAPRPSPFAPALAPALPALRAPRAGPARGRADMGAKQSGPAAANGRTRAYSGSDLPSSSSSSGGANGTAGSGARAAAAGRLPAQVPGAHQPSASGGAAAASAAPRSRSLGGAVGTVASGARAAQSTFSIPNSSSGPYGSQDSVHSSPEDGGGGGSGGGRDRPAGGGPGGPRLVIGSLPAHLSPHMFGGFKCPVCSKFVPSDEMDLHLVMCLTKPRITYNEDVLSKDAGECSICLEELQQGDTIARLPCLCIYHKGCIDEWFEVNRSCPEHPSD
uniref:E3 ubiquitin-protein ligase ZNRF2 n=1 Tax=Sus scrofa TaxID=9823 RepID=A0A8D1BSP8_PIG